MYSCLLLFKGQPAAMKHIKTIQGTLLCIAHSSQFSNHWITTEHSINSGTPILWVLTLFYWQELFIWVAFWGVGHFWSSFSLIELFFSLKIFPHLHKKDVLFPVSATLHCGNPTTCPPTFPPFLEFPSSFSQVPASLSHLTSLRSVFRAHPWHLTLWMKWMYTHVQDNLWDLTLQT